MARKDNGKRELAKREKKKAKNRTSEDHTAQDSVTDSRVTSLRDRVSAYLQTPALDIIIAFRTTSKLLTDLPDWIFRAILFESVPQQVELYVRGFLDEWTLEWGPDGAAEAVGLLLVNHKVAETIRPIIGERTIIDVNYTCPVELAFLIEREDAARPSVPFSKVPRYIAKRTKLLRVRQSPLDLMLRAHKMDVSRFQKLQKLEIDLGDIGHNTHELVHRVDDRGMVAIGQGLVYDARRKLKSIQDAFEELGLDFEEAALAVARYQELRLSFTVEAISWRTTFGHVVRSGVATDERWGLLRVLCVEGLGLHREEIKGLRADTVMELVLRDDSNDVEVCSIEECSWYWY